MCKQSKIMKKQTLHQILFAGLFLSVALMSCKKDEDNTNNPTPTPTPYTCSSCVTTSQAKAAYDASSKGVYKGIVIGSTGTIKFDISNDTNLITAVLTLDGIAATLTSAVSWTSGVAYVADFTGTFNGAPVTVKFQVDATGTNPVIITSSIPGHPGASFTLEKEKSTALLECFEGIYSTTKPETGTFNILLSRKLGKFGGASRETGSLESDDIDDGSIDASNNLLMDGIIIGKLSGDTIDGSFKDSNGSTVTIKGKRTL